MTIGQVVNVGTFSRGRVTWVGSGEWAGYCTVSWGGGFTLELIENLR